MERTNSEMPPRKRVALVLAGAVARGAYEAGALSQLLPELDERGERPRILVGTSSGALNAAFLASRADEPAVDAAAELVELWKKIDRNDIFRLHWRKVVGLTRRLEPGLLDTGPLEETITTAVGDWDRIGNNIRHGHIDALALAATATATGRTTVFVDKRDDFDLPEPDDRKGIDYEQPEGGFTSKHLMASAAMPLLFAPVNVDCNWYVDGGVRLNTPIKPAIALEADAVVVVATNPAFPPPRRAISTDVPPDWDDCALQFLQAAVADPLIEDMYRLASTNALVRARRKSWRGIRVEGKTAPIRPIPYLFVGPADRGVFGEQADVVATQSLNPAVRFVSWALGKQGAQSRELLSYVMFEPQFASVAIEMGREHAAEELRRLADEGITWRTSPLVRPTAA